MDSQCLIYLPLILPLFIFIKHILHKLQNLPPTPLLRFPILGHLHLLQKPLHRSLAAISRRHGPVVLLHLGSRRVLLVSSPSAAEDCLSKNDAVFANRPRLLVGKHLGYNHTSLVWSSYGDHWRNLRKVSSVEVLSAHRLQTLEGIRVDEVWAMVRALSRASGERKLVDMKAMFFEMTMNVVMRMIGGKAYYGGNVEKAEEGRRFREIVAETMRLMAASNMGDYLPWLGDGGVEKRMVELHRNRDDFMQELVEECKIKRRSYAAAGETKTMIEMLLALQDKEPEYYTDELIRSLMLSLVIAGTDTSSGTMEWALSLLLNNPLVLKKAQAEIDGIVGHGRLLCEADVAELPYLRCIISETLRMYPAAPLLVPHESSEECTVGGYRVPGGTMLMVNTWAIQNDGRYWEDAAEFKPERFEGSERGRRDGCKMIPFGSGRRRCPGEGLAARVLGLALGSILQCFDWEREGEELVDMKEGVGVSLPRAAPLMAYCTPRSLAAHLLSNI